MALPRLPPNKAWEALDYAQTQPWFAERLERVGVPIKRTCIKEEVRYKVGGDAIGWTGHELSAVAEVDDEPDDDAPVHFEPAIYDYRIPSCLAVLCPNDPVAVWAAQNWTPEALETLRALTHVQNQKGSLWMLDRDSIYVENVTKMYEDAQTSERPGEDLNPWEKDM